MSEGFEVVEVVDRWLWDNLTGDATLTALTGGRITGDDFPTEERNPIVTWEMSSTRDILGIAGQRIGVHAIYTVKAIGEGFSYGALLPIANRIDELLGGASGVGAATPHGHLECHRERVIRYPEGQRGAPFRHLGAMYRILVTT